MALHYKRLSEETKQKDIYKTIFCFFLFFAQLILVIGDAISSKLNTCILLLLLVGDGLCVRRERERERREEV